MYSLDRYAMLVGAQSGLRFLDCWREPLLIMHPRGTA